ncbi:MAG: MATE family efflux transporter [Natrialbaceae archaeon]|nr:MATE family efflux transporter [Natrialbaceae archaeon]
MALVFLPAIGLGQAMDTVVGQNLGAGKRLRAQRAVQLAIRTGAVAMIIVAIIAVVFARPFASVFLGDVPNATETLGHSVEYVRIRSVEFAFVGITHAVLGAFRGAGYTGRAMVVAICTQWIGAVTTVSALVLVVGFGPGGIWIGITVGTSLAPSSGSAGSATRAGRVGPNPGLAYHRPRDSRGLN